MRRIWPLIVSLGLMTTACATSTQDSPSEEGATPTSEATPTSDPASPSATAQPSALASGAYGPVWEMDPEVAFEDAASCENLAGLPTQEQGQNVAWRAWRPGDWSAQESLTGACKWFGPEPWEPDLESSVPPEEVAIVITLLDGRVTPGSDEFEGGEVTHQEQYTVAGTPAVRYEISGSDGEYLVGDGVIWVIGVQGELPSFEETATPNYMAIYTSSTDTSQLADDVEVLDAMVATLELLDE